LDDIILLCGEGHQQRAEDRPWLTVQDSLVAMMQGANGVDHPLKKSEKPAVQEAGFSGVTFF
jgi:hypothetical protein